MNKINKNLYKSRIAAAGIIFVLTILAFTGSIPTFLHIQLGPQIASLFANFSLVGVIVILSTLLLTLIFGRLYCSTICPFGILQDIIGTIFTRKSGKTVNPCAIRYFITAVVFGSVIGGSVIFFKFLDPYTNFSLLITNFLKSPSNLSLIQAIIVLVIIFALVIFKNRIFCTIICPVGTILGLCSKYSLFKLNTNENCTKCGICEKECPVGCIDSQKIDNERCIKCFRCIEKCPEQAMRYEKMAKKEVKFSLSRRNFIVGFAFLGVILAGAKAGLDLTKKQIQNIKEKLVLPPGASSQEKFASKCTYCNLCVLNCKGKVLKGPDTNNSTVHLDFSSGKCEYDCNMCNQVCPTGALKKMSLDEKKHCKIGTAKIDIARCTHCGMCIAECPTGAIKKENSGLSYTPDLNPKLCIGCGACQMYCPAGAIKVEAVDEQTIIES